MKIRNGFVSNSSSSSYIVKIKDITMEEFCEKMYREYSWFEFNIKNCLNEISKRLESIKKSIEKYSNKDIPKNSLAKMHEECLASLEEKLARGKKIATEASEGENTIDIVKFILEWNAIKYSPLTNGMELHYFTSMHNSFDEGMSSLLQEILMYFMFDTDYDVVCVRDGDD